jgi:NADH-quinone oxidoreductase subunit J
MNASVVVFALLSVLTVASAVLVVTTPYLVHAALWLVVTLGSVAGCFLVLTAELVAWVQVLVYVGAVVVLLLFALMLTRAPTGAASATSRNRPAAFVAALATTGVLVAVLGSGFHGADLELSDTPTDPVTGEALSPRTGDSQTLGEAIFTHWVLAFELLSVVLLAALVGAIVVSGRVRDRDREAAVAGEVAGAAGGSRPRGGT